MSTKEKELGSKGIISSEHRNLVSDLKKMQVDPRAEQIEKDYKNRALENLSKSGVFRGNQEDIEREITRLKTEDAENN